MLAVRDCTHAQLVALTCTYVRYTVTLASLVSLIVIDADSGPLGSERSLYIVLSSFFYRIRSIYTRILK